MDGPMPDAPTPTMPSLRTPLPDLYVGRHSAPGTLRTSFSWTAATVADSRPISYELQFSADPTFAANVIEAKSETTSYTPATDFPVSQTPPVGTRYHWRVRACTTARCGEYSKARWVNFGRNNRDFNGDGFSDVVVGAPFNNLGGANTGRAYVFFGGAGTAFNAGADGVLGAAGAGDQFGVSVAPAGDVNADGFTDLLVGATLADGSLPDTGSVSLYYGGAGATFDATPDAVMFGKAANERFGRQVAPAGDLNGDGYADIIVGAHFPDPPSQIGHAYIYYGGAGAFDKTADGTLAGEPGEAFGGSVASAGDVNGDGFADVIVGAHLSDVGSVDAGRALVFLGGAGAAFDTTSDQVLTQDIDDWFGYSVASAGDVNGDGLADVVVGSPGQSAPPSSVHSGRAYVYLGTAGGTLSAEPSMTIVGGGIGDSFGRSVASAGDVNGDGADDLLIGAYLYNASNGYTGRAYLYYGAKGTLDATADGLVNGPGAADALGNSVALAGDVNGDGFSDFIVGASRNDGACSECGSAFLYFGQAGTFDTAPKGTLRGSVVSENFGHSVASLSPRAPRHRVMQARRPARGR